MARSCSSHCSASSADLGAGARASNSSARRRAVRRWTGMLPRSISRLGGVDGLVHFNAPSWAVRAVMSSTTLPVCPKTGSTSPSLTVHLCYTLFREIGNAPAVTPKMRAARQKRSAPGTHRPSLLRRPGGTPPGPDIKLEISILTLAVCRKYEEIGPKIILSDVRQPMTLLISAVACSRSLRSGVLVVNGKLETDVLLFDPFDPAALDGNRWRADRDREPLRPGSSAGLSALSRDRHGDRRNPAPHRKEVDSQKPTTHGFELADVHDDIARSLRPFRWDDLVPAGDCRAATAMCGVRCGSHEWWHHARNSWRTASARVWS